MGTCQDELEITAAAIGAFARLLTTTGRRFKTQGTTDGGLICEDRTSPARPAVWKISPDGGLVADSCYSYPLRAFTSVPLPRGV
jgi:hypothetical protein